MTNPVSKVARGARRESVASAAPYLPANGSEGEEFEDRFCRRCQFDVENLLDLEEIDGCEILADAQAGSGAPPEWVENASGDGVCTAFRERTEPGVWPNARAASADAKRYDALPRDPTTGRPVIA